MVEAEFFLGKNSVEIIISCLLSFIYCIAVLRSGFIIIGFVGGN